MRFFARTRGFSFIEMMMVMMLALLLMGIAWPSFNSFWIKAQELSNLELLEKGLNFARQQALLRKNIINFCQSSDQQHCASDAGNGFIIFMEVNNQNIILHAERFSKNQSNLYWRGFPYQKHLQFLPNGMTNNENGSFWYCFAHRDTPAWWVVVNKAGRARLVTNTSLNQDLSRPVSNHENLPLESRIHCPV